MEQIGFRSFIASELRNEFFIDITPRHAGQTQEHLQRTCTNLPEIMLRGAQGVLVEPEFENKFAAEATLHYTGCDEDWKILRFDDEAKKWFRLTSYCQEGDLYHFPPGKNDEVGVVIGSGDTVEAAIDDLKAHLDMAKDEPIRAEINGFADLLTEIKKAQADGVHFSDAPLPSPAAVLS